MEGEGPREGWSSSRRGWGHERGKPNLGDFLSPMNCDFLTMMKMKLSQVSAHHLQEPHLRLPEPRTTRPAAHRALRRHLLFPQRFPAGAPPAALHARRGHLAPRGPHSRRYAPQHHFS